MKPIIYIHTQAQNPEHAQDFAFWINEGHNQDIDVPALPLNSPTISELEDAVRNSEVIAVVNWTWQRDPERAGWQHECLDEIIAGNQVIVIQSDEPIMKEYLEHALCLKMARPTKFTQ